MLWTHHPLLGPVDAMPTHFWGPEELDHQAWMELVGRLDVARESEMLLAALAGSRNILDVGGGTGLISRQVAQRFGRCTVVEPSSAQSARILAPAGSIIDVKAGRAEALPVVDGEFDAVLATWVLQYTADPFVAVAEMARACADEPGARVLLVQAAPSNQLVEIYNAEAKVAGTPRAHHGWLLAGAIDVLEMRGFAITVAGVKASVRTDGLAPREIASLLKRLHFAGHPRASEMLDVTEGMIAGMLEGTPGELADDGVLVVARR